MRRRALLTLAPALGAWPRVSRAQNARFRVGWLTATANPQLDSFRAGMRALGYVESQNLTIEQRDASGALDRIPSLAADLERSRVDVIVAIGITAAAPAKAVLKTTPIVFITNDPVSRGLVESLTRPGGNATGLEMMVAGFNEKWLEFLIELRPRVSRIGVLAEKRAGREQVRSLASIARNRNIEVVMGEIADVQELPSVIAGMRQQGAESVAVMSSAIFHGNRQTIVDLMAGIALPAIYEHRDFVLAGGLMSYGPSLEPLFRRLAYYVDRILRGTKPADLPVEQPFAFELVLNLRTARNLKLPIPDALTRRADELIE